MTTTTATRPLAPPALTDGRRTAVAIVAEQLWRNEVHKAAWKQAGETRRRETAGRYLFTRWRCNRLGALKDRCPGRSTS